MILKAGGAGRIWAVIGGVGIAALAAIQFVRPAISHPPVTADLTAPAEVKQILRNSCYDCHSNETRLAWFDQIVPAYWLVARDVKNGRSHLNFSEIGKLPLAQQKAALYEAVSQIQLAAMPPSAYTRLHHDAVVSATQLSVLKSYLDSPAAPTAAAASDLAADDAQYQKWIREGSSARAVAPAPNGIQFPSDYKNWRVISTTDRFDNQTMRIILCNDAGIKALAGNHTNPWPDGTMFAKVAWLQRDDGHSQVGTGEFWQAEFMIRDSKKYAATEGWGWARWRGAGLTPYGQDAGFSAECIRCHAPMRQNDFVFTMPLGASGAKLAGTMTRNPLHGTVITSSIDKQGSTMSTLYGNEIAARYARGNSQQDYPVGSVLALVTWTQHEDIHWFGAKIPSQAKSVEFVSVTVGTNNQTAYLYEDYEGWPLPLRKVSSSEGRAPGRRAAYLLSRRAAVMP